MKKFASAILPMSLFAVLITGCNNGENKDHVTLRATDSSLMTTTDSANKVNTTDTGNTMTTVGNQKVTDSSTTAVTVKPNPAKKGKKGMVSIPMNDNKTTGSEATTDNEGYYTNVYPSYPGGDKALESFFAKNVEYPASASDNGVEGTVRLSFTVDETGKIGTPKVITPAIGYGLEEEALRIVKKMPSWKPGALKGKNVKTRFTLPVRFQLEG
jgi:TonB family protein